MRRSQPSGVRMQTTVFYATNRAHEGPERFHPLRYGTRFSADGMENLRFGRVTLTADDARVSELLLRQKAFTGPGDGEALQDYFAQCARESQVIEAYQESIPDKTVSDAAQPVKLGSLAMFSDLQSDMQKGRDVLVLIHGFNVSWEEAVGTAAAFEAMVNRAERAGEEVQPVRVILFTWPSDGQALPWVSYKSDRSDARSAAGAVGRAMLKLRDFLHQLGRDVRLKRVAEDSTRDLLRAAGVTRESEVARAVAQAEATELCGQKIHLLAHSMGNYVLQHALDRLRDFSPGNTLPRMFDHVFLAAPDVDDTVLEHGQPMEQVHQIGNAVAIYHNPNDTALRISDTTKGNPDRLGQRGAARPQALHQKIYQVDCSAIVSGLTQHSYYTNGSIAVDIRKALQGQLPDSAVRGLRQLGPAPNMFAFVRA
jgi:esterase/lipase superfamily enzyme